MNDLLPTIFNIGFIIIGGLISLVAVLAIYIYVSYGRMRSITVLSSLVFIVIFISLLTAAYATLQTVIEFYA